ncbi:hypothetical protein [Klebsiella pneumoniae]|uniref:hypothetical protein n=1 Tax=Klebsiella pneumoniae TaxID=573 RepID=UPI0024A8080D|nr:hypothetical protein [Klebsiella pneumoniae]HDO7145102.1 hypothetical protein [Klebsiella pneumoniae]HDO7155866.1 hypothetical protein [Klebsiella pneumoniae]
MKKKLKLVFFPMLFFIFFVNDKTYSTNLSPELNSLPNLQVIVILSPAAKKKLLQYNEKITVSTSWYGFPLSQKEMLADESGQIKLSVSTINLSLEEGIISLHPQKFEAHRLTWLRDGVYVNVNIYSARKHWSDNILACDFIDGRLVEVARKPVTLNCSLITEDYNTKAVEK